jgi:hypothetical protein
VTILAESERPWSESCCDGDAEGEVRALDDGPPAASKLIDGFRRVVALASARVTPPARRPREVVVIGGRAAGLMRRAWLWLPAGDGSAIVANPPEL